MSTRPRGVTLVELIVFIVIVGVAMAGLFAAFNTMTAASADPQVRKQVLAIAESLMDEVSLMPFTFCDPDDANAQTATSTAGCAVASNNEDLVIGPENCPGASCETRYVVPQFDNVSDYHGFSLPSPPGIKDISNTLIPGLSGYSASINIARAGTALGLPADREALRISVTVNGPSGSGVSTTLEGYRALYAPNTVP